jgi:uncharacterized protein YjbI with pentapeptide repeats
MHISFEELINANQVCCSKSKVASENGKRFEIISNEDFTKIKIDDCLIKSQEIEKCDFGFVRNSNNDFYFVELKGTNIQKAFDQIISTINYFETNLIKISQERRFGFIISSSVPKAGISSNTLKQTYAKKYGKVLEIKNRELKYIPK